MPFRKLDERHYERRYDSRLPLALNGVQAVWRYSVDPASATLRRDSNRDQRLFLTRQASTSAIALTAFASTISKIVSYRVVSAASPVVISGAAALSQMSDYRRQFAPV
ncbi:hypothetical protein [Sphingomonas sp. NIC1]|uniref:hypothetical protein n=1 Tax=Sphingomonas sp. NIC1 TaxID=1961362 RepID=UPI00125E3DF8|nr:hypothetical protein [Sphingomonas sp. NIC1]